MGASRLAGVTEPTSERLGEHRANPGGLSGPVLWSEIAWLAVATLGLVPTAVLFVRGITAMIGFMVGMALVVLPLYTVFQLWHTRTVATAVRSAISSISLAALVLAMWTASRGFDWAAAGISGALGIPGVLSLFAARQLNIESRLQRVASRDTEDQEESISQAEAVVIALILVATLVAAFVVLGPTFSTPIGP